MASAKYIFDHAIGVLVFDEQYKLLDTLKSIDQALEKYPGAKQIEKETLPPMQVLEALRDENLFSKFRAENIIIAKKQIKQSFSRDQLIIQTVTVVEDLEKVLNALVKRTRDWYSHIAPEISHNIDSHEKFIKTILESDVASILKEQGVKFSMGTELSPEDKAQVDALAKEVDRLFNLKDHHMQYIERLMKEVCPNMHAIAGTMIGAKLLAQAGSLEKLSQFPASTIQLLGAEKALFRHMKTGAKPPKYGILINHSLLAKAQRKDRGKIARALADKISIASKVDYFKGDFIGDKLKNQLDAKFGSTK